MYGAILGDIIGNPDEFDRKIGQRPGKHKKLAFSSRIL